ncbi:MAG: hypothetical protein M1834_007638 [Cirrosporium novae-zelandiae]|nr:MAG: hypothetical protein M1834_007638 [Cirrosporium novae-zelandiae]
MANSSALAGTFKVTRILQFMSLIVIIGMVSYFIQQMINSNTKPPEVLIATLSIVCIAALYCIVTIILEIDGILPYLISTGIDGLLLIALIVVAVVVGKPLSYLNCYAIDNATTSGSAYSFTAALGNSLDEDGTTINYSVWIGATKTSCLEMKSIWGLSIALCVLFALSAICTVFLWKQSRSGATKAADVEEPAE